MDASCASAEPRYAPMGHPAVNPSRVQQGHLGTGLVHIGAYFSQSGESAVLRVVGRPLYNNTPFEKKVGRCR